MIQVTLPMNVRAADQEQVLSGVFTHSNSYIIYYVITVTHIGSWIMDLWITDRARLVILLAACALLSSIELFVPLFRYRRGRWRRAVPNLLLAAGVLMTNFVLASIAAGLCAMVNQWHVGLLAGTRVRPL